MEYRDAGPQPARRTASGRIKSILLACLLFALVLVLTTGAALAALPASPQTSNLTDKGSPGNSKPAPPAQAQPDVSCSTLSFATATNFGLSGGLGPTVPVVGDFNGDGKQDLAIANYLTSNVSVLLGNGSGGFGTATNFGLNGGTGIDGVTVGDFNGDGKQDLATANGGSNNVSILLGNGSGGFGTATLFDVDGVGPEKVVVGDFNGDGKQDLATPNGQSNNVSILLGNGSGGFGTATNFGLNGSTMPYSVVVGDFNGDGKQDLATPNGGSNNVSILLGNGSGGFGTATNFGLNGGSVPVSVVVGDFNGDGKQDLATTNAVTNNVSVLLGNGSGGFGTATNFGLNGGINPASVVVGDFNGDGRQDLATTNNSSDNVSVLLGNGSGSFGTATNFALPSGSNPESVAVGDFNRDGRQDIATANNSTNNVSVLLGNCAAACDTGYFGTATNFGVNGGTAPNYVAVGDFNGDGEQDLAAANYSTNNVSILLGNGTGGFSTATNFGLSGGINPNSVAVGDFNGDGKQDLATANNGSNNVSILLGTGTGSFNTATNFGLNGGSGPNFVAVGDFNGDGKQDLATANAATNNVSILLGTGTGSFGTATNFGLNGGSGPREVAVGDFNGDGKQDLVTANNDTNNVSILLGTGAGSFGTATNFGLNGGSGPREVAVGDFNGDGKQDLVTANGDTDNVSVLLGDGAGGFGTATNFGLSGGSVPVSVAVGDFNGDGKQDLVTANAATNDVSVLLGTGTGGFGTATNFGLNGGSGPYSIAVGDFNGDGKQDIATANNGSNNVSILLGICAQGTPTPTATPTAGASCPIVTEGFESGLGQFVSAVPTCVPGGCGWAAVNTDKHSGAQSAFAPDLANISDQRLELTNPVSLPAASSPVLSFWHRVDLESGYDGGVLEFSTDGGSTWTSSDPTFISGGYSGAISTQFQSPIAGRNAWTGVIGGAGAFAQVQVNLSAYAGQNNFKFRFREANDSSNSAPGWWVDDVTLSYNGACGGTPTSTRTPTRTSSPTRTNTAGPSPTACLVGGLSEGFEGGNLGAFTNVVATCVPGGCNWTAVSSSHHSGTYSAFAPDVSNISDQYLQQTNALVPASGATLTFWHLYNTESTYDGAVLEATTNGGSTWTDMGSNITSGGYNGTISTGFQSPIAGRQAWTGTNSAYTQVTVNLSPYAGQNLRIRFRLATDSSNGATGWNIDDISISGTPCPTNTPTITPTNTNTPTPPAATPTGIATACTLTFADVPAANTFYTYVRCLACLGIINGYPCGGAGEPCDGNNDPYFRPGNNLTRGQLAKIVAQAAGLNGNVSGQSFEDVPPANTFYVYIERLYGVGAIGGYPCGGPGEPCGGGNLPYYRPGANVTRGQLTKIVSNAAGFSDPAPATYTFTDVPVGSTFHVYVERLLINRPGVMGGYACGGAGEPCDGQNRPYFRVNANLTRGQTSKIVGNTFFPNCQTP